MSLSRLLRFSFSLVRFWRLPDVHQAIFFKSIDIYIKLFAAFVPTAIVGLLAYDFIKGYLFNPIVVSVSLILGGVILILIDKKVVNQKSDLVEVEEMTYKSAFFLLGFFNAFPWFRGLPELLPR